MKEKWSVGLIVPMGGSARDSVGEWVHGCDTGVIRLDHDGGSAGHEGAVAIHTEDADFAKKVCIALNKIGVPKDA